MFVKKIINKLRPKKSSLIKKPKKTIFDLSLRDVGRASKRFLKGVIIKTIRDL